MREATKREIEEITEIFVEHYRDAKTELNYNTLYELLVAVILSAQCTDKRVNIITPKLFEKYPDINSLANASLDEVKELIKSCSFFNNKAKNIINMAKEVKIKYKGEIPLNRDELIKLSGVGQKTANVIMIEYKNSNFMAVDTHVFRVSHRLGLSYAKNVKKTEEELVEKLKDNLHILHQGMVLFGRYICKAKNPLCDKCIVQKYCKTKENFKTS